MSKKLKCPKLIAPSGEAAKALRKSLGLNQSEFWRRVTTTQSGGSRYESGREIPESVQYLLHLAYGTEKQAGALLDFIRGTAKERGTKSTSEVSNR